MYQCRHERPRGGARATIHHFVLLHGAWHGAWCWERLRPELERRGAAVTARDLPGHGQDRTPPAQVDLEAYADRVCAELRELDRRVELVAHSMAGVIATAVAERLPGYLTGISYVAALVSRDGESASSLAQSDSGSRLSEFVHSDPQRGTLEIDAAEPDTVFYHDCPAELIAHARTQLRAQPVAPLQQAVKLSAGAWQGVPRAYIVCEADRAVTPATQHDLARRAACDPVVSLACGHSPFFAQPERLADALLRVADGRSDAGG